MKNFLKDKLFYLSSPIEFGVDNWRYEFKENLINKFKINIYDPFLDPKQQWTKQISKARKEKNFDKIASIARNFVLKDYLMVDKADGLIAYLPYKVPTIGVHYEISRSLNSNKPTFLICPEGKELLPVWYYGIINHKNMFGNFNDFYDYLEKINNGLIKNDDSLLAIYDKI